MKNILTVLLLAIALTSYSQVPYKYYEVQSGTNSDLYDIAQGDVYHYYICGANGTLLWLKNLDSNWITVQTNTNLNYNRVSKNSSSTGFNNLILSNNGLLLLSSNSGYNWVVQGCGFANNLNDGIGYSDKYILIGDNGLVIRKLFNNPSDTTWHLIENGTTGSLKSITYFFPNYWIVGDNGFIRKSTNNGYSWYTMNSGVLNTLNSVNFISNDTGFIVGNGGLILKSYDGGLSWTQKNSGTTQNLNRIAGYSNSFLYVAGNKVILYSTNKGENWIIDTTAPKYNFYGCCFIPSSFYGNNPYFVGEGGRIYKRMLDSTFHPNINVLLNGNNINSSFMKTGIFDKKYDIYNNSQSGFEWPKGSNKYAIYSSGLCISAFVNNNLRQVSASYSGEYSPGYCEHGIYKTGDFFKYFKISRGDNAQNNWDWANWGMMVPYGAPFIDVNHNGIYEPEIDTPGVRNAVQTIFYCMTDAYSGNHSAGEGFGGGTLPLGAEVHLTAWAYDSPGLQDVQFINYEIINKSDTTWKRVKIGTFSDPDLGDPSDDYIGCDTSLKLSFCYNAGNNDDVYGLNPPAIGFTLLTSSVNKSAVPNKILGMTSSISPYKYFTNCEGELGWWSSKAAYFTLSGYKNDSTSWVDPTYTPYAKTKYTYSGDPETNTGWTRLKGSVANCNQDSTGNLYAPVAPGDMKMIFGSGAEDFSITPGDTQKFVIAQMIARGTSNLNSVTELKNLCEQVRNFYDINFPFVINPTPVVEIPQNFLLAQNYPNPFNSSTRIKFEIPKINGSASNSVHVTIKVYDLLGREIQTLANGEYLPNKYEIIFEGKNFASGMYFYRLTAGDFTAVKRMVLIK